MLSSYALTSFAAKPPPINPKKTLGEKPLVVSAPAVMPVSAAPW